MATLGQASREARARALARALTVTLATVLGLLALAAAVGLLMPRRARLAEAAA